MLDCQLRNAHRAREAGGKTQFRLQFSAQLPLAVSAYRLSAHCSIVSLDISGGFARGIDWTSPLSVCMGSSLKSSGAAI